MRTLLALLLSLLFVGQAVAQERVLLRPERVFDGVNARPHQGWSVLVQDGKIAAAGLNVSAPAGTRIIELPGMTLMPGMIEGHTHLFLHPYNETSWDDQVLRETLALRTARAVSHARATLMAGFTTARDLGTAKVWVSIMGTDDERKATMKALTDAAPWLRRQLGGRLTMRHIPQLVIRHDDSIEAGDRVLRLLREIEQKDSS